MKIHSLLFAGVLWAILIGCEPIQEPKMGVVDDFSNEANSPEIPTPSTSKILLDMPSEQTVSENTTDLAISQNLRIALFADKNLSAEAKNIKIFTEDGVVILRGALDSAEEKNEILKKAKSIDGVKKIEDQIQIRSNQ